MKDLTQVYKERMEKWNRNQEAVVAGTPRLTTEELLCAGLGIETTAEVKESNDNAEKIKLLIRIAEMMGLDPTAIFK